MNPRRPVLVLTLAGAALAAYAGRARSAATPTLESQRAIRCATRLSIALTGQSPSAALLGDPDPQGQVGALLASPAFVDGFARFANAKLNDDPGMSPAEDATYYLAQKILTDGKPWRDLFVGKYDVVATTDAAGKPAAEVRDDPNGLGYFRSRAWMVRYAGNEEAGYRIVSAFRMMQNTTGLAVVGIDSVPTMDLSATGRMAAECRGCHYDSWFALDHAAKILSRRVGTGPTMTFAPPSEGPQVFLDGKSIANDAELVAALVASTNFRFRACRLAFEYLYGRGEDTCEADLFDRCVDAFAQQGTIQAAISTIATDPGFCQ